MKNELTSKLVIALLLLFATLFTNYTEAKNPILENRSDETKTLTEELVSGNLRLGLYLEEDDKYSINFTFGDNEYKTFKPDYPVYLEIRSRELAGQYDSYQKEGNELTCISNLTSTRGSVFRITDRYIAVGNNNIELERNVEILTAGANDNYFNSIFGIQASYGSLTDNEYFIPGAWYKNNFDPEAKLPSHLPQAADEDFLYREDRIPLPMVMVRNINSKDVITIIHKDSENTTVMADNQNMSVNKDYKYGALGIIQNENTIHQTFIYPGNEKTTASRNGIRFHPVEEGIDHQYKLRISFSNAENYSVAIADAWENAFSLYNPTIYPVDLKNTYDGVIETLLTYYVPSVEQGGTRDAPGFPFQVSLTTFEPLGIDYQMGFVGMQIATAYYLLREGLEKNDASIQEKGEAVLNFWANNCLTSAGFPKTWYDPGVNGATGSFRDYNNLRTCTGGMEGLVTAWCFAKKNGLDKPNWIDAGKRFGDWMVNNQNEDGSFYYSYNQNLVINGKHPVRNNNKYLTICAVRYLVELYIATGEESYREAALKAGEFCWTNIHEKYHYLACVVDNPETIDSESGQMAMNGFLSLYDLTKDNKWLTAAEQAAIYNETWVYSFEIPVENNRTTKTSFPKDRSIVGQHLIAIGHAAADLGFAWSSFAYYRLYLETGNEHYLQVARMSAHNSKQSMNWDQSIFPGRPKGLQLEAFPVTLPRRTGGVMTTLNWNYAAHLDPMFRFKDAFGTPDMEEVEQMPLERRLYLADTYSDVQSSDYGQRAPDGIFQDKMTGNVIVYPNPVNENTDLFLRIPENIQETINVEIYNTLGSLIKKCTIDKFKNSILMNIPKGTYICTLKNDEFYSVNTVLVK